MKCRKVIKDKDHYNVVWFGSTGLQNPYAIVFKEKEKDAMPEVELNDDIYTNKNNTQVGNAIIKNIDIQNKKLTYNFNGQLWNYKEWEGLISFDASNIWSDGENIYYSSGSTQKVLNKSIDKWEEMAWGGVPFKNPNNNSVAYLYREDIWTDGENFYFSNGEYQYVLDKSTNIWSPKTWKGLTSFGGKYIWSDGTNIYYSNASTQYKLNGDTWEDMSSTWLGLTNFYGFYVWKKETDFYYSAGSTQYKLNKSTYTWEDMSSTWSGLANFYGNNVWKKGTDFYYSSDSKQYVLDDISPNTWNPKTWQGMNNFSGIKIWNDGDNFYYSYDYNQYKLNDDTWENKDWLGMSKFLGQKIWSDGDNFYYSYYDSPTSYQYVLDKSTNTWIEKEWQGLTQFDRQDIWTDGTDIYYSSGNTSYQYVLNKETSTWSPKTWEWNNIANNQRYIYGRFIWKDGDIIYQSNKNGGNNRQFIFDKSTSTWSLKTWYGLDDCPIFYGKYIWNDGENFYYSYQRNVSGELVMDQYALDKSTDTWSPKTWNGGLGQLFTNLYIWTDGENIYYSNGINQYVLDKETSSWLPKVWDGRNSFSGQGVWNDGEKIYLSNGLPQYYLATYKTQLLEVCYYNKETFNKNKTNIVKSLYLKMPDGESSDQEISFDIVMMAKKWKEDFSSYATEQEGLASSLIQRLSFIKGELRMTKVNYGIPLLEKVDKTIMDSVVIDIVLSHPDVRSILNFKSKVVDNVYQIDNLQILSTFNETITIM